MRIVKVSDHNTRTMDTNSGASHVESFIVKGRKYFRLVEKIKQPDGKWKRHIIHYIGNEKAADKYMKAAMEMANLGSYFQSEAMKQPELGKMALSGIRMALHRRSRQRVPTLTVAQVNGKLAILPSSSAKYVTSEDE